MKTKLFLLAIFVIGLFAYFSYTVAKESWQKIDFDTTVKIQDRIPRKFDYYFSYFSLLGSAEITIGFCLVMIFLSFLKQHFLAILGWLVIIPATFAEIFGKLMVFHPGPPVLFHRSLLPTSLPSFYVHTDFSYPSGHMTRTAFIVTVFVLLLAMKTGRLSKLLIVLLLVVAVIMGITRVYLGEHWLSDVLGGALLGLSSGLFASILILPKQHTPPVQDLPS